MKADPGVRCGAIGRTRAKLGAATAAAAVMCGAPAMSADAPAVSPAVQAVVDCRASADTTQRLACYDDAVAKMAQAQASGDLVTVDREQRRAVRRQAFGLTLPTLGMFDKGEKAEEVNRLTDKVTGFHKDAKGKWVLQLETGAVWRQIDDNELMHPPRDGSTVEIRKGALGSFFMNIDGQLALRVHRDN
jgi:hypothetical protein